MLPDLEAPQFASGNGSAEVAKQSYRVVEVHRDNPESLALLMPLVDRCMAFSEKYRSDTLPDMLRNLLFSAYQAKSDQWKLLVALDEDGQIVAHAIADIEPYGLLGNVVFIIQIQKDVNSPGIMDKGWEILRDWARKYGVKHILNMALSEAHARLYQKEYGFKPYRFLLKIDTE